MKSQETTLSGELVSQPSYQPGSPANLTVLQENVRLLVMTVISGRICGESFGRLNPDGSLLKMSQGSYQANLGGSSEESFTTFPRWGIMRGGAVGKLPISGLLTTGKESSLLPTIRSHETGDYQYQPGKNRKKTLTLTGKIKTLLPTPTTPRPHDNEKTAGMYFESQNQKDLVYVIGNLLPTPTSRDHKDAGGRMENVPTNHILGRELGKNHGMRLQPAFVEWMMGLPAGWTVLSASEMPLSRSRSTRSLKKSRKSKTEG